MIGGSVHPVAVRAALLGLSLILPVALPLSAEPNRQTEVGSEEERLRRPKELEVPERPTPSVELPAEEPLPGPSVGVVEISVSHVLVEGATLIPDQDLSELTVPLIGRRVSLGELRETARAITRWYRRRGYVTSRAFIPAQSVEEGRVRIRVLEGKVGSLTIEGNRYFSKEVLLRHVKVRSGEIFQLQRLERSLSRLNAHPDRKVTSVLVKGARPETTDLIFRVTDRKPIHASYGIDTLGTKATGEFRHHWVGVHGNLTGQGDQGVIRGMVTEFNGLRGGTASYLRPLGSSGLTGTLDVSGVKSNVGGDLKSLLARGDAVTVSPGLIIPWFERQRVMAPEESEGFQLPWAGRADWEVEVATGFDFKRIRTYLDEVNQSKDDLRVARFGMNLLEKDTHGRSLFIHEIRWGIGDFLGASHPEDPAASRLKTGGSFLRWVINGIRIQPGPWGTSLLVRGSAQLTTDRLVPAEQFRLGGFDTVRGYPEGEFLADSGFQGTLELRAGLERLLPERGGRNSLINRIRRSFLLVGFWDYAEGFIRDPTPSEDADARLSGVGCGFRLRPTQESSLQLDLGWPLGDRDSEKDRPRVHLICRVGF